jgi:hypothetical protein
MKALRLTHWGKPAERCESTLPEIALLIAIAARLDATLGR